MPPTFAQPERRSFLLPILFALLAIALAIVIAIHFFPATTVNISLLRNDLLPTQTRFKSQTIVIGATVEETLFIASTVQVENLTRDPIYLDGASLTFSNPDDTQLTAKALTKDELNNAELSFPALKALAATPLAADTVIDPAKSAHGTLFFSLPIPKSIWDARKVATIKVDLYHRNPIYQDILK